VFTRNLLLLAAAGLMAAEAARAEIPVVELVGPVHAISAEHVVSAIERADAAGAPLLVLRVDTPGGFTSSMKRIIDAMLNCKTPVVTYVGPSGARAASAGFLILIAADVAAMAPGTNAGAASPVSGLGSMDETMRKKVTSDLAAYVRSKAERRGRNVELAEKAVLEATSFTEAEALKDHLIDLVAKDVPELIQSLDGRTVKRFDGTSVTLQLKGQTTAVVAMNWRQQILALIADPEVLFLLLLGALVGLGTEISHPGALFPGIIGALCLILFLFAAQILPVNWAGVALIVLAIGLFAAEVKVHSYGLLTVSGITAMILGALMLVEAPVPEMRIAWTTLAPAVLVVAAWALVVVRLVLQAQRRRASTGREGMIEQLGVAETDLAPEGWVRVSGERWKASAESRVASGEPIVVTSVDGLTLKVRKGA
jgi:membrane-bound serine protease (ClpP class)